MDQKIRNGIGAFAIVALLGAGAFFGSLGTVLILALALTCMAGLWIALNHFFPAHGKTGAKEPPTKKRTPSSANVLGNGPVQPSRPRQESFTEKQWRALQNELKSSSGSNPPRAAERSPNPRKTVPIANAAAGAETQQQLIKRQDELGVLIARSRKKAEELEKWVQENVGQVQKEGLEALFHVRLIVEALQKRFDETHSLLSREKVNPDLVRELMDKPLAVESDAVNHVSSKKSMRPLRPDEWEPTLAVLFKQITRRKSYFRNAPDRPSTLK